MDVKTKIIGVVIPCYNVDDHLSEVVNGIPDFINHIILVNDQSADMTEEVIMSLCLNETRIVYLKHDLNQGVGGAMITGMKKALELECDYIIKLDGDGQMDSRHIPKLLAPLNNDNYQFAKGNRFNDFVSLRKMPFIRRIGNLMLSFMIKAASGYWSIFDPTNGFFCIKKEVLERIDFSRIGKKYFFESSLLIELYYTGAKICDVPIPAQYGDEKSNLSVFYTMVTFPIKITKAFVRRIFLRYFIYDFNIFSIYISIGFPLFLFGIIFGIVKWIKFETANLPAPTGTVMLATLSIILGFQLLLSVIQYDISSKNPFSTNPGTDK